MKVPAETTTHRIFILHQTLVIPTQTDQKQNTGNILETVDPLPAFGPLATDIHHGYLVTLRRECPFYNADRAHSAVDNVSCVRLIIRIE
jgi:hypothetical protein